MAKQRYNPNLAKTHHSYTVEEVAALYCAHKQTVRQWVKQGLIVCDDRRPMLILGSDLRVFHQLRNKKNKCPCPDGTLYCVRCREPKTPVDREVCYVPMTSIRGRLVGLCSCCGTLMNRITSLASLDTVKVKLKVTIPQAEQHISDGV